mmetsp:Transcript_19592/g.26035  ORF Transcript_19592/g.26035 Transcript_19592/m.26035 type:complete len:331 (-) Transcript_19592:436-1428(-)
MMMCHRVVVLLLLSIFFCSALVSPGSAHATNARHSKGSLLFPSPRRDLPRDRRSTLSMIRGKQGSFEIGIETAQLLLEPRNHQILKDRIKQKYPLLPQSWLDVTVDIAANALETMAPEKLKQAISPGGLEEVLPDVENAITEVVLKQQVVKELPILSDEAKAKLIKHVVDVVFDHILENSQYILAAPEVRLEALEEEMREVKAMMGPRRLTLYKVRKNPRPIAIASVISISIALRFAWKGDFLVAVLADLARDIFHSITLGLLILVARLSSILSMLLGKILGVKNAFSGLGIQLSLFLPLIMERLLVVKKFIAHHVSNKAEFISNIIFSK